jgi:hypothetical protein
MSVNDTERSMIDESRVTLQIVASLTDDSRGVIYNCNIFLYRPLLAQKVKHLKEFLI